MAVHLTGVRSALIALPVTVLALLAFEPDSARASNLDIEGCHAIDACNDQVLRYHAAPGEANDLTITRISSGTYEDRYEIEDTGAVITLSAHVLFNPEGSRDPICSQISPTKVRCDSLGNNQSGATSVVRLGDMNDNARVTPPVNTSIFGDAGNDTISLDALFDDLHGGDGDDLVISTDANEDRLYGDAGNDTFESAEDPDDLDTEGGAAGDGIDTFDFSNRNADITAVSGTGNPFEGVENFIGGDGDDTLTGDDGPNSIAGGRGDDILTGLAGNDTFDPGPGRTQDGVLVFSDDDTVNGGDGAHDFVTYKARTQDLVIGMDGVADDGASTETDNIGTTVEDLHGGSGDDQLTGNASDNILNGWTGADVVNGVGGTQDVASYEGRGADLVLTLDNGTNDGDPAANSGAGEGDRITFGIENIWGGRGDDDITGSSFFFNMSGGTSGINELRGGWGDDDLEGMGNNDILRGNGFTELVLASDDDSLDGGDGNDFLDGDTANAVFFDPEPDDLIGGAGIDLLDYSARTAGVTVDIPEPPPNQVSLPPAANDGQAGEGDRVYSSVENVDGGAGSDSITGSSAVNVLNGGSDGRDTLSGLGSGDTLTGGNESGTNAPGDTLNGGDGTDSLDGGDDNDALDGGADVDGLSGGTGNDALSGGAAGDSLTGGDGNDLIAGDAGADTLNGDAGADQLAGGSEADQLNGAAGGDTLNGDGGVDQLNGGTEGDTLNGGTEGDTLNAGGGFGDMLNGDAGADNLSTATSQGAILNGGDDNDTISSVGAQGSGVTQLNGGAGTDSLTPGTAGRDAVTGGDGIDSVSYAGRALPVTVTIGNGTAFDDGQAGVPNGDDRIGADVENVTGGPAGDTLTGNDQANALDGGAGPDTITGGDGADTLLGGTEDDHLKSRDAFADQDNCGTGTADKVTYDAQDTRTACERLAPTNTAPPTISGTPQDAEMLTANQGTWDGEATIAFAYRWRRCDADGVTNCADIAGDTADDQDYTATPADVGHALRVRVIAVNGVDSTSVESAATTSVAANPPENTAVPTMSGTLRDAETVSASPGTWTGTPPITYEYRWRSCDAQDDTDCSDIAGATDSDFQITSAEVGRRLRVQATATNAAGPGESAMAESDASDVVASAPPTNTVLPTVTGETQTGQTLTADAGTWSGTPTITHTFQWRSCDADSGDCVDIAGATGQTYVLTTNEVARRVRVHVTATNDAGDSSADSAPSKVVTGPGGGGPGGGGPGGGGPGGSEPPSNDFTVEGTAISSAKGQATITVNVPGPGILALTATSPPAPASARARAAAKRIVVARILRNVTAAGRVKLVIKPKRRAMRVLRRKHRLRIGMKLTYTPAGGTAKSITRTLTLKLKKKKRR
jgi:Ca2+-binding RTX toxin-like protein